MSSLVLLGWPNVCNGTRRGIMASPKKVLERCYCRSCCQVMPSAVLDLRLLLARRGRYGNIMPASASPKLYASHMCQFPCDALVVLLGLPHRGGVFVRMLFSMVILASANSRVLNTCDGCWPECGRQKCICVYTMSVLGVCLFVDLGHRCRPCSRG